MTSCEPQYDDLWVFGYGSLMWRPEFPFVEKAGAVVSGYVRRFCIWSHHWRGTPERPGLVLGLDARDIGERAAGGAGAGAAESGGDGEDGGDSGGGGGGGGGECRGVAYRVAPADVGSVLAYLRERELMNKVYFERRLPARLDDGRRVETLAFVVDRDHRQYAPPMDDAAMIAVMAGAAGRGGPNLDYLFNTVAHLEAMGCCEPALARLAQRARARLAAKD